MIASFLHECLVIGVKALIGQFLLLLLLAIIEAFIKAILDTQDKKEKDE